MKRMVTKQCVNRQTVPYTPLLYLSSKNQLVDTSLKVPETDFCNCGDVHKMQRNYHEGFIDVNCVPTHIITYGRWLEDSDASSTHSEAIILVIPGNPGIIDYYDEFMESLYKSLDCKVPVWGISHAGHVKVPANAHLPTLHANEDLYNLQGQIHHKLEFVENYVPRDKHLVLIGHSIGAYIILEMMRDIPKSRIAKAILLFPTVEKLALSPQGQWAKPLLTYFQYFALFLVHILFYLSKRIQYKLVEWYLQGKKVAECTKRASLNLFEPSCAASSMFMGRDEMQNVQLLDVDHVSRHIDDIIMYYGADDHWCPRSYLNEMKARFPTGKILLCDRGFDHAFVLESSKEVAEMVAAWVQETIDDLTDN